jgi:hypothetical protein
MVQSLKNELDSLRDKSGALHKTHIGLTVAQEDLQDLRKGREDRWTGGQQ